MNMENASESKIESEMQLNCLSKRRKLIDETLEKQKDRISALPDAILLHILTFCSTEEAIRTGALSKRWQYVWTSVPVLIFDESECLTRRCRFIASVNRTLLFCRHNKLDRFKITCINYYAKYQSHFHRWIRYAVGCNVEELVIYVSPSLTYEVFTLPKHLFRNSCLKTLRLGSCNWPPIGDINWKNLKHLHIGSYYKRITQELISNILTGSPSLEILVLLNCYGFDVLNITSTSLRKLVIAGYYDTRNRVKVVKIQAPNILSLTIKEYLSIVKVMLVEAPSLVEAELDYERKFYNTAIVDDDDNAKAEEEILTTFIQSLRHVKRLKVGQSCLEVLSRLKAKGFTCSPNMEFPGKS